jgi:hypothetical protein
VIKHASNLQTPTVGNQNMQMLQGTPNTTKDPVKQRCFNYGEKDHYAHVCPKLRSHCNWMPSTIMLIFYDTEKLSLHEHMKYKFLKIMKQQESHTLLTIQQCTKLQICDRRKKEASTSVRFQMIFPVEFRNLAQLVGVRSIRVAVWMSTADRHYEENNLL